MRWSVPRVGSLLNVLTRPIVVVLLLVLPLALLAVGELRRTGRTPVQGRDPTVLG